MKKLQNNFTTPEQSEKLLAMGIPANTADLYYERHSDIKFERLNIRLNKIELADDFFEKHSLYTPHWSVGRLIEICLKCSTLGQREVCFFCDGDDDEYSLIDYVVNVLESSIKTNHMDFSKLED